MSKKIGILFGQERVFPMALIERINGRNPGEVFAEPVRIDKVVQGRHTDYAVIIDRISHEVPFYRSYLKGAAMSGTAVMNNPFWWSADEKFFNNCLAVNIGVPVPKTVIIPSKELPEDTSDASFSNLAYPLDWEGIFEYIGFPAFMKPYAGGGWKNVYKLSSIEDFFHKHAETGRLVMLLQEDISYSAYYRSFCIGGKHVRTLSYEPRHPYHLRYQAAFDTDERRLRQIEEIVLKLNRYLGYDMNSVEIAFRDDVPYAIDFCNPVPDAERISIGDDNFEWLVETTASYAIERALAQRPEQNNLTWGEFLRRSINRDTLA